MTPEQLTDEEALESALAGDAFLLFKHSPICPVSRAAFERYAAFLADATDVRSGWLNVIAQRPLSRGVAERTGVRHESPQALLFRDGQVVWHASHEAITEASLAAALQAGSGT